MTQYVGYYCYLQKSGKDMEQKLDEWLSSITALKKDQADNQKAMSDKLERLEHDVHEGQEVAAE